MIVKKIANKTINITIIAVVPHPGATFPYSEFSGFKIVPNLVIFPLNFDILFFEIVVMKNKNVEFLLPIIVFSV
jgi:hypothetical protein